MVDTVIDMDSLIERVEKFINVDDIDTKNEFIQALISKFFKGEKVKREGLSKGQQELVNEMWDRI